MTNRHDRPVLALDPGLQDLGYALLSGRRLLDHGVLPLRNVARSRRLGRVNEALAYWIRGYRPNVLIIEHLPRRPLDAIGGLPALGRLLRRLARRHRLTMQVYSPRTVRRSVAGDGWAGKRKAAEAVTRLFPELRVHLTHDRKWKERYWQNMFDAVALAHHHLTTKPPSRSR